MGSKKFKPFVTGAFVTGDHAAVGSGDVLVSSVKSVAAVGHERTNCRAAMAIRRAGLNTPFRTV